MSWNERFDLRWLAGNLEDEMLDRRIDDLRPENLGEPQRFDTFVALAPQP